MDPISITIALGAVFAGGAAASGALLLWRGKRSMAWCRERWTEAANRVGGELELSRRPMLHYAPMAIKARLHDVGVVVDHDNVTVGNAHQAHTLCRARALGAAGLRLKISRRGAMSALGRSLGFQQLTTNDGAFDERFVVKTSDEDLARLWLDQQARAALMPLEGHTVELKRSKVRATAPGLEDNTEVLVQVMEAVATLAAGGRRILGRWRDLAEELEGTLAAEVTAWSPDADIQVEAEHRGARLVVDTYQDDDELLTRVCCHLVTGGAEDLLIGPGASLQGELKRVDLPDGRLPPGMEAASPRPDLGARRLTAPLCERITRLLPDTVYLEGQKTTVLLDGVLLDARRIREAADLAMDLATTFSEGVYR